MQVLFSLQSTQRFNRDIFKSSLFLPTHEILMFRVDRLGHIVGHSLPGQLLSQLCYTSLFQLEETVGHIFLIALFEELSNLETMKICQRKVLM